MAIEWTPALSVGVEYIDNQHKEWFEKANNLLKQERPENQKNILVIC